MSATAIIKWKAEAGCAQIERCQCTRETAASVWVMVRQFRLDGEEPPPKEVKFAKSSNGVRYFDSWAEAQQWLLDDAHVRVLAARRRLELSNSHYGNVKGMKEPG